MFSFNHMEVLQAEYWKGFVHCLKMYNFRIFSDECYSKIYRKNKNDWSTLMERKLVPIKKKSPYLIVIQALKLTGYKVEFFDKWLKNHSNTSKGSRIWCAYYRSFSDSVRKNSGVMKNTLV